MLSHHPGDPVLPQVQCPQFAQASNVTGNLIQEVVVESQVLQHGGASEESQGEDSQSVVVQGERAEGGEGGQGGLGQL